LRRFVTGSLREPVTQTGALEELCAGLFGDIPNALELLRRIALTEIRDDVVDADMLRVVHSEPAFEIDVKALAE
jgi:hypothetical protein